MNYLFLFFKTVGWLIGILVAFLLAFTFFVWKVSDILPPPLDLVVNYKQSQRTPLGLDAYRLNNNWIRKNRFGLYEMYLEGNALDRGMANGCLSQELIIAQEEAFVAQIKRMIPSERYLRFLKYITGFMNKNLPYHVSSEYKQEIYGISTFSSDEFEWIGNKYARQLNYHAAHDIGHALQNMMLVGCTSFGAWNDRTMNGSMLIGRNFDFWVGDEFAENKIIAFVAPENGHKFAFVTWAAFIGVSSGMNEHGLTVTINAANSSIPIGAATPVSLVAREILQYASNIEEAYQIANNRKMFVSESFLIGSAKDGKAVVIEKTPDSISIFEQDKNYIICSNHYQSDALKNTPLNQEQIEKSASLYRQKRTEELLHRYFPLSPQNAVHILRNHEGLNDRPIGLGNEKALNQLIAHHSIVFQPDSLRFWVSTNPWQLGEYICYDLNSVFNLHNIDQNEEIDNPIWTIQRDSSLLDTEGYSNFLKFRKMKNEWVFEKKAFDPQELILYNPQYYESYRLAGDYANSVGSYEKAIEFYNQALKLEIATHQEREQIENKLNSIKTKHKRKLKFLN